MEPNFIELENKIKQGKDLNEAGRLLESALRKNGADAERGYYYYLYGYVFYKLNLVEKALEALEEAVKLDNKLSKAYFLFFKIYYKNGNNLKAVNSLEKCIELDYKAAYCYKTLIKVHYRDKDYPVVVNFLAEKDRRLRPAALCSILRTECLKRLKLEYDAVKEYEDLKTGYKLKPSINKWFESLLEPSKITEYETNYLANLEFFKGKGFNFERFEAAQFKICSFLDDELIYDSNSRKFIVKLQSQPVTPFSLGEEDALLIYNPDHIHIFKELKQALAWSESPQYQRRVTAIPVFVVERNKKNWELIMQLFDFTSLGAWNNMNFYIGISDEDLAGKMLDEYFPIPNVLFGSGLDNLKKLLEEVKESKDQLYQRRKDFLQEHYQNKLATGKDILIITTIYNDSLFYYGKALKEYLTGQGYNCYLYNEAAPYYKFTNYSDARIMDEFKPDSIIHFFALKEESDLFKDLKIPYTTWFMFYKNHQKTVNGLDLNQRLILTGNLNMTEYYTNRGFYEGQIDQIPIPAIPIEENAPFEMRSNRVGFITSLEDFDYILKKIAEKFFAKLTAKRTVTLEEVSTIFRTIYFEIYTEQISQSFVKPSKDVYYRITKNNFAKKTLLLDEASIEAIAAAVKSGLENSILKLIQARWLMGENFELEIHGSGWEKEPTLKPYYKGDADFAKDPAAYRKIVSGNKINLYLGNKISNESLMQPDLINGIAAGGFFLVNDILVKEYGDSILKPFGGMLETYGSKEEMLTKIRYFLEHDTERRVRAKELQEYVKKKFSFELLIRETFLEDLRETELN